MSNYYYSKQYLNNKFDCDLTFDLSKDLICDYIENKTGNETNYIMVTGVDETCIDVDYKYFESGYSEESSISIPINKLFKPTKIEINQEKETVESKKDFIKTLNPRLQSTYLADYKLNDQTDVTKSVFISGLSGVGKTTIVLILARNYEKQIPKLVNSIDCIKYIHTLELQNLENLDFILQVPLLVLDGLENLNQGFKNNLETILTKRIQNNLTTYITSQKNIDSFDFSLDFVALFKENILVKELTSDTWLKNIEFKPVTVNQEFEATYLSNYEKAQGISKIVETISTNNSQKHLISLIKGVLNCDSQGNERLAKKLAEKYNIDFKLIKN